MLAGFATEQGTEPHPRTLWRVDSARKSINLYVSSAIEPDLTHLVEQAGWPTTATWTTREYGPFLEGLRAGTTWGFRLTANPTHSVRRPPQLASEQVEPRSRGQRLAHVTVEQQLAWLMTRAERLGIDVGNLGEPTVAVTERSLSTFRRQSSSVTIGFARFDGTLVVTDPDALRIAMRGGIGPAKAYGCGLLTLAPQETTRP